MFILLVDALSVCRWRSVLPFVGILLVPLAIPWYSLPSEWREWYRAREKGPCAARPWAASLEEKLSAPLRFCGFATDGAPTMLEPLPVPTKALRRGTTIGLHGGAAAALSKSGRCRCPAATTTTTASAI
jgi:hypothetical protein